MPCQITHMYLAGRLAEHYPASHENDVIQDIHNGFAAWLQANSDFRKGAESAKKGSEMQKTMDTYRHAIDNRDDIAIFSAFCMGAFGPDLWVVPHESIWTMRRNGGPTGTTHFDLGHYNLSHRFPAAVLRRIRAQAKSLPVLQRKYQTAYILGYLSHIALDIIGHIKVNVFAGAYFQLEKLWETEQASLGMLGLEAIPEPFNDHNKIEQYFDALIRFVCFEGYHDALEKKYSSIRSGVLKQGKPWDFPNYTDYWRSKLSFGLFGWTDGIFDRDARYLDCSTSLAGPFARHYTDGPADKRVTPFIHRDFCQAYDVADSKVQNHILSLSRIHNELPKVRYVRMDNHDSVTSQYYYTQTVAPNLEKINAWGTGFYNPQAFADFVMAGKLVAVEFIDGALKYLSAGDEKVFDTLRTWNLDIGMAIRFKDTSAIADAANPKKPNRPVTIDLVNVMETVPALAGWQPPTLNVNKWKDKHESTTWRESPEKKRIVSTGGPVVAGTTGTSTTTTYYPQSGLDIRLSQFELYADSDEIASFLFGFDSEPPGKPGEDGTVKGSTDVPDHEKSMYAMKGCIEDFVVEDKFSRTKEFTGGKAKMKEYIATYISRLPRLQQPANAAAPSGAMLTPFENNHLPRFIKVTACRKYVCQPNDTGKGFDNGNFHASKFKIYQNPFPSEEMALAIFPLIRRNTDYIDLFHYSVYAPEDVVKLKKVREVGVNVILLIFSIQEDSGKKKISLKIEEAWVDGERQPIENVAPPPTPSVYKIEFEDVLFRTDSAVVLPENYVDRDSFDPAQDRISGLDVLQVILVQAKEYPQQKLLIAGHTDRVAKERFNFLLSKERAESVLYLLCGKKEEWKNLADKRNHKEDKRQILAWVSKTYGWECDPGAPDDPKSIGVTRATKNFQKKYNKEYIESGRVNNAYGGGGSASKIPEDCDFGPKTWGAVFDMYQDSLAQRLDTSFEEMNVYHSSLDNRWVEDANKAVPCGETYPKECPELDEYECAVNRRVEVLFFDPKEMPPTPLPCNASEKPAGNGDAGNRTANCRDKCPIYKDKPAPQPLSVTPHARPQTSPTLFSPPSPGSADKVLIDNMKVYLIYFKDGSDELIKVRPVRQLQMKAGKFCDAHGKEVTVDGDRETWLYFSNREGLDLLDKEKRFKKSGGDLPIQGPYTFPCGEKVTVDIDIWAQKDWAIVRGKALDGQRPTSVAMAEQQTDYSIGASEGANAFRIYGSYGKKDSQEKWGADKPIPCVKFGSIEGDPCWVGTLSALPTDAVKLLLADQYGKSASEIIYAGSFNSIKATGDNQIFSHHTYDKAKVAVLMNVPRSGNQESSVDALAAPPDSFLLPGDTCWHDQDGENACGPFSFAAAMNYWFPYSNNPKEERNGMWYHNTDNVPSIANGARTPANIVKGAEKFNMNARDNDAENLDKARALKLLRSWICAGIPVTVLVKEYHKLASYHWKLVVGYEGDRFLFNNSGADLEYDKSQRTTGVGYERAPVGNDVDSIDGHYVKWQEAGGDIADFFTSVDRCTFIPLYPKDTMFEGDRII
ncbi:MAG: zinc dependent phospholipase C family protein [Chitinispirillaceae bacterium]|nr:zinc dependent phospholipase C family protein [Chitinispirillaceae bacterium]